MAAADKAERLRAGRPASLVQVYTAGLRWDTELMIKAWTHDAAPRIFLHRLPWLCGFPSRIYCNGMWWRAGWCVRASFGLHLGLFFIPALTLLQAALIGIEPDHDLVGIADVIERRDLTAGTLLAILMS